MTLNEVIQKTNLLPNEILYHIYTGAIAPVLHSEHLGFLAVSHTATGHLIGHAHFQYTGPLMVSPSVIQALMARTFTLFDQEPVTLLLPDYVVDYATDYPYEAELPTGLLNAWEPISRPDDDWLTQAFTILLKPHEYPDWDEAETGLTINLESYHELNEDIDLFIDKHNDRLLIRSPHSPWVYGPDNDNRFELRHLRFPKAAVERLINLHTQPPKPKVEPPFFLGRTRKHALHSVVWSLFEAHPTEQYGSLWNILWKDVRTTVRTFDPQCLITHMDALNIHWVTPAGIPRQLKRLSFKTLISRFRNQVTPIKS